MAFNYPGAFWLLAIIPLLLVVSFFVGIRMRRARGRLADPALYGSLSRSLSVPKHRLRQLSFLLGAAFLMIAMTGPRFGTRTEIVQRMGVDMVIALDTSYSMLAEDVRPNRITQAKYEIARLIDHLQGDRVGLVAFAGDAVPQCPLTTDYGAAKTFLGAIDIGVVPLQGTNLENAIERSIRLLAGEPAEEGSQLIVLVTDGESIDGNADRAADRAARLDISIYTVGIGTESGEIIPIRSASGNVEEYKKDSSGNMVKTHLDEATLRSIAETTGGAYLYSAGGDVDIQAIIDDIGTMHKNGLHERTISRLRERYQVPLGISLFFLLTWFTLGERRRNIR